MLFTDNMYKYIVSSSATKPIKNSVRLVTDLLASSDYASFHFEGAHEKINIRSFNNSLITSPRQYDCRHGGK